MGSEVVVIAAFVAEGIGSADVDMESAGTVIEIVVVLVLLSVIVVV